MKNTLMCKFISILLTQFIMSSIIIVSAENNESWRRPNELSYLQIIRGIDAFQIRWTQHLVLSSPILSYLIFMKHWWYYLILMRHWCHIYRIKDKQPATWNQSCTYKSCSWLAWSQLHHHQLITTSIIINQSFKRQSLSGTDCHHHVSLLQR